jgi:hypothetical protein
MAAGCKEQFPQPAALSHIFIPYTIFLHGSWTFYKTVVNYCGSFERQYHHVKSGFIRSI